MNTVEIKTEDESEMDLSVLPVNRMKESSDQESFKSDNDDANYATDQDISINSSFENLGNASKNRIRPNSKAIDADNDYVSNKRKFDDSDSSFDSDDEEAKIKAIIDKESNRDVSLNEDLNEYGNMPGINQNTTIVKQLGKRTITIKKKKIRTKNKGPSQKQFTHLYSKPNIYQSSNLEITSRKYLVYGKGIISKYTSVKVDNSIVPTLKPTFKKLQKFKEPTSIHQMTYKSPDEVLTSNYKYEPNELNYKSREEINNFLKGVKLPDEEITNSIQYYFTERLKKKLDSNEEYDQFYTNFLNGSVLLALSTLVTNWVEEEYNKATLKQYMKRIPKNSTEKLSKLDEFIRYHDESDDSEMDEEVSTDNTETDTDTASDTDTDGAAGDDSNDSEEVAL